MKSKIILFALFSVVGCSRPHRDDHTASIGGLWAGPITANGTRRVFHANLIQTNGTIGLGQNLGDTSYTDIDSGHPVIVTGDVEGNTFHLSGNEGSLCVNRWNYAGHLDGDRLTMTIDGDGNAVAACYPTAIHTTVVLTR